MAKEQNGMVTEATENKATEQIATTAENKRPPVYLTRETFKMRDGRSFWSYVVRGKKYGREMKAEFAAKDKGGYEFLDMLFDISDKVELVMHEEASETNSGKEVEDLTLYFDIEKHEDYFTVAANMDLPDMFRLIYPNKTLTGVPTATDSENIYFTLIVNSVAEANVRIDMKIRGKSA